MSAIDYTVKIDKVGLRHCDTRSTQGCLDHSKFLVCRNLTRMAIVSRSL
jgi:hypothetical protein